jgi:hypothetical protein
MCHMMICTCCISRELHLRILIGSSLYSYIVREYNNLYFLVQSWRSFINHIFVNDLEVKEVDDCSQGYDGMLELMMAYLFPQHNHS